VRVFFCCNLANIDTPCDIPKLLWESFYHDPVLPQCLGKLWMWKRGTIVCEPSKLVVTVNLNPLHIPTCGKGGVNNVFPLCSTLKVLLIHLQSSSHPFNCCAYIGLILFWAAFSCAATVVLVFTFFSWQIQISLEPLAIFQNKMSFDFHCSYNSPVMLVLDARSTYQSFPIFRSWLASTIHFIGWLFT